MSNGICIIFLTFATLIATFVLQLSDRIRNSVQDLGNSCVDVVNNAGAIQSNPSDTYAKKDLIENSRAVSEKVQVEFWRLN